MIYKLQNHPFGGQFVTRLLDNANIPFDPANTDYQVYLVWLAEGNTPLEASTEVSVPADETPS